MTAAAPMPWRLRCRLLLDLVCRSDECLDGSLGLGNLARHGDPGPEGTKGLCPPQAETAAGKQTGREDTQTRVGVGKR